MLKTRLACSLLALLAAATAATAATASAQQWGGRGSRSDTHRGAQTSHVASGGTWSGRQPVWGGSPPQSRSENRAHRAVVVPYYVVPVAVAAPPAIAAPVEADTVYTPVTDNSYHMQVVTAAHPAHELTTLEVYRLQPRFQKP